MRSIAVIAFLVLLVPQFASASEYDLEDVDLVSPEMVQSLNTEGVRTTLDLLKQLLTSEQRSAFAARAQLDETSVKELAIRLELMQLAGIGAKAAALLNAAGVTSCVDLASRDAATLLELLLATNAEKAITGKDPDQLVVADWIEKAKTASIHLE